jgi:hypothetical protein
MARLTLGGFELQDLAAGIWFDVVAGGLDEPPSYDGEDDGVIGASGREPGGWLTSVREVVLEGHVWGVGATADDRRMAYRAKLDELQDVVNPAALTELVAHGPNEGLESGQAATLSDLRARSMRPGPSQGSQGARSFRVELTCIASPPEWSISGTLSYLVTPAGDPLVTPGGDPLYVEV